MLVDYHMHFEYGSYDINWVEGFFQTAQSRGIEELGISEHSHGFKEFKELYYKEIILDDSYIGNFQKEWLKQNKFKTTIKEYVDFINDLKKKGFPVKLGMEICNFKDQKTVEKILKDYKFDYLIGSVHFIEGWAFDSHSIIDEWKRRDIHEIYEKYTEEVERMCYTKDFDILGHPFNIRLFKYFPEKEVKPLIKRIIKALKENDLVIDVNTGTKYRYSVNEISPYVEFMIEASKEKIPIVLSSDAHMPYDAGKYVNRAAEYVKSVGYDSIAIFEGRNRKLVKI